jgi:hypothetical protein
MDWVWIVLIVAGVAVFQWWADEKRYARRRLRKRGFTASEIKELTAAIEKAMDKAADDVVEEFLERRAASSRSQPEAPQRRAS